MLSLATATVATVATVDIMDMAMAVMAMDIMARGKPRLLLLPSLDMATTEDMVTDMADTADMADTDIMATMARGRQLLSLLLSPLLLPNPATDTMAATVATEAMVTVDMVTTAIMARGPLMLMPSTATEAMEATEATEDMVMDTVMATTARDLRMPPMATVMAMVMVMVMVTVMVMGTDTTDKKEGIVMTSRVQWIHNEMDL